jgi:electron transfer flavoprotein beta subunit
VNVIVCLKQVPDTETKIKVAPGGLDIVREGVNYQVSPYDEFAIEEALRLRERFGGGQVTLVTLGPQKAEEALRFGLSMGADRAIHVKDEALLGGDPLGAAAVLAAAVTPEPFDLILTGKLAIDDYQEQMGALLAERLSLPSVALVTKLEVAPDKKRATVTHDVEGGREVVEVTLPAVLTCQKGLNEPRYPSLPNIMKAKKKPIDVKDAAALGLDPAAVGPRGARITLLELSTPPPRIAGKRIDGDAAAAATTLVRLLREEAKVI